MPVLLTSPAFDKQVGDTYSGPAEDFLLSQGYATREGYEGPGVASTGPVDVPPAKDLRLAANREGADVDENDGHAEDFKFSRGKGVSARKQSEVDDQDYVVKTAGDPDQPLLPLGDDFGSVNASDEAKPVDEQVSLQNQVRAFDADGEPAEAAGPLEPQDVRVFGEERVEEGPKKAPATNHSGSAVATEPAGDEAGADAAPSGQDA